MGSSNSRDRVHQSQPQQRQQMQQQQQNYQQQYQPVQNQQQYQQQQQNQMQQQQQQQIRNQIYTNQSLGVNQPSLQTNFFGGTDMEQYYREELQQSMQSNQKTIPTVNMQKTVAVKNDLIVDKLSLKMEKNQNNPSVFDISFKYSFESEATIQVFYCGYENTNPQNKMTLGIDPAKPNMQQNPCYKFNVGKDQTYPQQLAPLDIRQYSPDLLTKKLKPNYYPLVLRIEKLDKSQEFKVLYMYGTFNFKDNFSNLDVKIIKQKIELNGQAYEMNEVYGINQSGINDQEQEGVEKKECVVCMTELVDTIILPCKHMCLCFECCTSMRQRAEKCPMCRQPIEEFMKLEKSNPQQQQQQQQ